MWPNVKKNGPKKRANRTMHLHDLYVETDRKVLSIITINMLKIGKRLKMLDKNL